MSNQQDPDTRKSRHEQREQHESSLSALLGTEPAQRQALAAQFVQEATQVSARILVVNPGHLQALQGRAQVYRQLGMEQAAELHERTLQALSSPLGRHE